MLLEKVVGKGFFVKELKRALLEGCSDITVHSIKDVPVSFPDVLGLDLYTLYESDNPHDAFVWN
ncbi:MAG: hypothetical protein ACFC1C_00085 [Candidatus Malihini olakiniferum]